MIRGAYLLLLLLCFIYLYSKKKKCFLSDNKCEQKNCGVHFPIGKFKKNIYL